MTGEEKKIWRERYALSKERVKEFAKKPEMPAEYADYFKRQAAFILRTIKFAELVKKGSYGELPLEKLEEWNQSLYDNLMPEHYETAYENPVYAVKMCGARHGRLFTYLAARLYELIPDAAKGRQQMMTILMELFLEVACRYEDFDEFAYKDAKAAVKSFETDYLRQYQKEHMSEMYDPEEAFFCKELIFSDTSDLRYLYRYGIYISENERETARYLHALPEEQVRAMADTYVDGYLRGFEVMRIPRKEDGQVLVHYPVGFERMISYAVKRLEETGLKITVRACPARSGRNNGYLSYASMLNPQFGYDHRQDEAFYLDKQYAGKKLEAFGTVCEEMKELLSHYIGPAVVEAFGVPEHTPANKKEALHFDRRQQKLKSGLNDSLEEIVEKYIHDDETSYTIIAYPVPAIGADFKAIFDETVRCNTLDNEEYIKIQQILIDELDTGYACRIRGKGPNETDLTVMLAKRENPEKETLFENCTADVNIPVGEVFTSPKLAGTDGLLHVSKVYLNGYEYRNLKVWLKDGKTERVSCENFPTEAENQEFLKEMLLRYREWLPLGEFAIGTNTTAYVMGEKYGIAAKLPILIAEKTGPHFALGDTCYSRSEDHKMYNPDGKEMIARDNELSLLRRTDPSKAYFNCHTDITVPYGEIGEIASLKEDGRVVALIRDGRFVLPGTEKLNLPLEEYNK